MASKAHVADYTERSVGFDSLYEESSLSPMQETPNESPMEDTCCVDSTSKDDKQPESS